MSDSLVEAIRATPDDDAPRLVWADREGGDRGELVVVQCAIARHDRPRDELRKLYARERELLERVPRWPNGRYERGFVVHRSLDFDEIRDAAGWDAVFAATPALCSVTLPGMRLEGHEYWPQPDWKYVDGAIASSFGALEPGRIVGVEGTPEVFIDGDYPRTSDCGPDLLAALAGTEAGRALRTFRLQASLPLGSLAPFRSLFAFDAGIPFAISRFTELAKTHLGLRRLSVTGSRADIRGAPLAELLAHPFAAQLTELDLGRANLRDEDAIAIASSPHLARLEHLGLAEATLSARGIEALARSPHLANLRSLDLRNGYLEKSLDDARLAILRTATFAEKLRVLNAEESELTEAAVPILTSFPALEQLSIRMLFGRAAKLRALHEILPSVT